MYSGYRVNGRISDRAEIRTPNFVLVLGLFLFYFSLLLDLHDAFTTCSMTNTTVTSDLAPPNHGLSPPPNDGKKRGKKI